ncbi:flavodoxin [Lapidilactobacillus salsurivasis]
MAPLILYFSHPGENFVAGKVRPLTVGNTAVLAKMLGQKVGGTLQALLPVTPYPLVYQETVTRSKTELTQSTAVAWQPLAQEPRPAQPIFLGFPIWWGTLPVIVSDYLRSHDWAGQLIYPFCTHEGSGGGDTARQLTQLCAGAQLHPALIVRGSRAAQADLPLTNWLAANYDDPSWSWRAPTPDRLR